LLELRLQALHILVGPALRRGGLQLLQATRQRLDADIASVELPAQRCLGLAGLLGELRELRLEVHLRLLVLGDPGIALGDRLGKLGLAVAGAAGRILKLLLKLANLLLGRLAPFVGFRGGAPGRFDLALRPRAGSADSLFQFGCPRLQLAKAMIPLLNRFAHRIDLRTGIGSRRGELALELPGLLLKLVDALLALLDLLAQLVGFRGQSAEAALCAAGLPSQLLDPRLEPLGPLGRLAGSLLGPLRCRLRLALLGAGLLELGLHLLNLCAGLLEGLLTLLQRLLGRLAVAGN